MKLLFDHNLSHKLVTRLFDIYPESSHTRLLDLSRAADPELWFHARTHGYLIVTKDEDFSELAVLRGAPPKVVWLRIGNCSTSAVEQTLRKNKHAIDMLVADDERMILELFD